MIQKLLPKRRLTLWLVSCLAILALVPAIILFHPGMPAHASGGGGGGGSPSASIYPTQGSPGTVVNINGFNYTPGTKVNIYFQTKANGVVNVVADPGGFFYASLTLPNTYTPGVRYYVHVNSVAFNESILFTFIKPNIQIFAGYNGTITFGATAQVSGGGFLPNETVNLTWNIGSLGTQKAGVAVAGYDGSVFSNITMPSLPHGVQASLVATGLISGLTASTLVVESPAIYSTPTQSVVGTSVKVQGGGFGSNEHVQVLFQNKPVASPTTNAKGAFSATFVVPTTAQTGYQTNGIIATGKTTGVGAQAFFTVLPNVTISPNSGASGTYITVHGSHFSPNDYVQILWVFPNNTGGSGGSGGGTIFIGSASVNSHGTFTATVQAPGGLVSGVKYFVQVIDYQNGASNQAAFRSL
ncbi:MAG TPA: hypothetical protein VGT44_22425 [Ktedonobacteraceae bacterium]|nr:hypothetical protein [Ktedonobacteraceae bacterium]